MSYGEPVNPGETVVDIKAAQRGVDVLQTMVGPGDRITSHMKEQLQRGGSARETTGHMKDDKKLVPNVRVALGVLRDTFRPTEIGTGGAPVLSVEQQKTMDEGERFARLMLQLKEADFNIDSLTLPQKRHLMKLVGDQMKVNRVILEMFPDFNPSNPAHADIIEAALKNPYFRENVYTNFAEKLHNGPKLDLYASHEARLMQLKAKEAEFVELTTKKPKLRRKVNKLQKEKDRFRPNGTERSLAADGSVIITPIVEGDAAKHMRLAQEEIGKIEKKASQSNVVKRMDLQIQAVHDRKLQLGYTIQNEQNLLFIKEPIKVNIGGSDIELNTLAKFEKFIAEGGDFDRLQEQRDEVFREVCVKNDIERHEENLRHLQESKVKAETDLEEAIKNLRELEDELDPSHEGSTAAEKKQIEKDVAESLQNIHEAERAYIDALKGTVAGTVFDGIVWASHAETTAANDIDLRDQQRMHRAVHEYSRRVLSEKRVLLGGNALNRDEMTDLIAGINTASPEQLQTGWRTIFATSLIDRMQATLGLGVDPKLVDYMNNLKTDQSRAAELAQLGEDEFIRMIASNEIGDARRLRGEVEKNQNLKLVLSEYAMPILLERAKKGDPGLVEAVSKKSGLDLKNLTPEQLKTLVDRDLLKLLGVLIGVMTLSGGTLSLSGFQYMNRGRR